MGKSQINTGQTLPFSGRWLNLHLYRENLIVELFFFIVQGSKLDPKLIFETETKTQLSTKSSLPTESKVHDIFELTCLK